MRHCFLLATVLSAVASAPAALGGAKPRIEVHGHRGARALRPENTLAAFDYALSVGVDVLELDLGVTADDKVVVLHDQHVNLGICRGGAKRKAEGGGHQGPAVRTLTLRQLKRFDCGSTRHPRFGRQRTAPGARIPTLSEVLGLVRRSRHPAARTVRLNIETKLVPGHPELAPTPSRFARLVIAVLKRHKMVGRSMLQSFDHRTLIAARKLEPRLRCVALVGESRPDLVAVARAAGARIVSPHHRWITAADVRRLHGRGIRVVPWTANDEKAWTRLLRLGVDGIITDDPAGLIRFLTRLGRR